MPQVPTNVNGSSILGRGGNLPEASGAAFGVGRGAAIADIGDSIGRANNNVATIVSKKQDLEDDKWSNDAMAELMKFYSPWLADNKNNSKESYAEDFLALSNKSLKDWEAKAPTKGARERFRGQFQNYQASRYASTSMTSAQTKLNNMLLSQENLNGAMITGYEFSRNTPNVDANAELMTGIDARFTSIDSSIGDVAPEKAKQLKNQLIEDSAYATMNYSPSTARKILEKGKGTMDGRRIHAIESQIKTAEESTKLADRGALAKLTANLLAAAENGKKPANLDIKTVSLYLPDDKAQSYVTEVNAKINAYNKAADHVTKVSSWNASAKMKYLNDLAESVGNILDAADDDKLMVETAGRRILKQIDFQQKDPAGAIMLYNPAAKGMVDQINAMAKADEDAQVQEPNPMIKQKQGELASLLLQLQSQPAKDLPQEQKNQHQVVNRAELMVMSKGQAEAYVANINTADPDKVAETIQSALANHPGYEKIAFDNLVKNGLDLGYWGIYKNLRNQNISTMVGALKMFKQLKETNPERFAEVNKALNPSATPRWDAFLQLFPNDDYQRQDITEGMRSAVIAYAVGMMQDKQISPELAVQRSVDEWIYKEMSLVYVNGRPVLMDRRTEETATPKTDAEMAQFAYSLGQLQNNVDPRQIDGLKYHFPTIWGPNGLGTDEEKWNQTQGLIANRGYFKPASGGEYSTLYMRSDSGQDFELRRNGRAIAVKNSEVETVSATVNVIDPETGLSFPFPVSQPTKKPIFEKGKKTVPTTGLSAERKGFTGMANLMNPYSPNNILNAVYGSEGMGIGKVYIEQTEPTIISTNWPVEPKYMKDR